VAVARQALHSAMRHRAGENGWNLASIIP
jgi:hypothetical protein